MHSWKPRCYRHQISFNGSDFVHRRFVSKVNSIPFAMAVFCCDLLWFETRICCDLLVFNFYLASLFCSLFLDRLMIFRITCCWDFLELLFVSIVLFSFCSRIFLAEILWYYLLVLWYHLLTKDKTKRIQHTVAKMLMKNDIYKNLNIKRSVIRSNHWLKHFCLIISSMVKPVHISFEKSREKKNKMWAFWMIVFSSTKRKLICI